MECINTRWRNRAIVLTTLLAMSAVAGSLTDFSAPLLDAVSKRWGPSAVQRLFAWQELDRKQKKDTPNLAVLVAAPNGTSTARDVLTNVNVFLNKIPYVLDPVHWGVPVYWATPVEFVASNGGKCVDYTTSKYFTLKDVGMPIGKMRMTYVRALKQNVAHMVLAYYPTPDADPLILDNLIGEIKPASQRPDLEPVYSFNDDDLWTVAGGGKPVGGASQIRLWQDLNARIARQEAM